MELTSDYAQELAQVVKDARILITMAASGQDITNQNPTDIFKILAGLEDLQDFLEED
jgi:hypothetical protein